MSIRKIVQAIRRPSSKISREIKRNSSKIKNSSGDYTNYFLIKANDKYIDRRKDCHRKSKLSKDVIDYLTIKINEHWPLNEYQIEVQKLSIKHRLHQLY